MRAKGDKKRETKKGGVLRRIKKGGEREMGMGIKKIFCSWRCFGRDPALATKILVNMVAVTVMRPLTPSYIRYNMRGLEMPKEECPEDTRTLAIGTALLYTIAFVVGYSLLYLTYGKLWY